MATTVGDVAVRVGADVTPLQRSMKKGGKSVDSFGQRVKGGAAVVAKLGTAVAAAGVAVTAFTAHVAASTRELKAQADAANISIKEFQSLSFAAKSVGVEQDKLADILKDVNDRVGDFIQTGGGPMADFFENIAPKVGVTADQFARLSGREALQLYVESLEKANLTQSEMTFFMEAIASDSTRLIGLFENSGEKLNALTSRYDKLNSTMEVSAGQAQDLEQLSQTFDLMKQTASNAAIQIASSLAPAINDMAEDALELVPQVTNAFTDFINQFKEAGSIVQVQQLEREISRVEEKIADLNDTTANGPLATGEHIKRTAERTQELEERLIALRSQLEMLREEESAQDQNDTIGEGTGALRGDSPESIKDSEEVSIKLKEIQIKSREELLAEQRNYEEKSAEQYLGFLNRRASQTRKHNAQMKELEAQRHNVMVGEASKAFGNLAMLMESEHKGMFEVGKAAAISQTVIDTYAAAQSSYRALAGIPVVGPGLGAAAAAAAIAGGLARVSAISSRSFSKSGGGGSDPGANASSSASQQSQAAQSGGGVETTPQQQVNLSLQGDIFSRQSVIELSEKIVELSKDGGTTIRVN